MPSSHAQFVAFFSAFLTLFLLFRHNPHHPHASSTHAPTPYWQRLSLALLSMVSAGAVAQSRVYLYYHTPRQVYVGLLAGVLCAVAWFAVTSAARHWRWVDEALDTSLARYVRHFVNGSRGVKLSKWHSLPHLRCLSCFESTSVLTCRTQMASSA